MLALAIVMGVLFLIERLFPGRSQPEVRGWWLRAISLNLAIIPIFFATEYIDPWFRLHKISNFLGGLPAPVSGLIGFVVFQFFHYWWHRARHTSDFLWRWVHQVHHSPQRLEVLTASYTHPLDAIAYLFLISLVTLGILGLNLAGAEWAVFFDGAYTYFIHSNIRTPYWIGYFVQRPEMHRVHHQYNVHRYNYALPIWDMLFGTHRNPASGDMIDCGFDPEKEAHLGLMLIGRDVHTLPELTGKAQDRHSVLQAKASQRDHP
jgi:sterol desaturase/sphingolipid hydroxylase (fatty acid hydroxylase superfamily)